MSPVRRRDPAETGTFHLPAKPPRDRVLTIVAPVAAAAVAVSVTGAAAVFVTHQTLHRAQIRDAQVLDAARGSADPRFRAAAESARRAAISAAMRRAAIVASARATPLPAMSNAVP